jgi:hypothetical protein
MRNLLAFVAALVLVFLGLGWYFNWYSVKSVPTSTGHQGFTIDVNEEKIGKDVMKGAGKVQQALEKHQSGDATPANPIQQTGGVMPAIKLSTEEKAPQLPVPTPAPALKQ